jgi:hypothetical protein
MSISSHLSHQHPRPQLHAQAWLFYDGRIGFRYLNSNDPTNARATGSSVTIGMQLAAPYSDPIKFVQVRLWGFHLPR